MTESKHTPKGYRIDGEIKYLRISGKGTELEGDATECEMELWRINTELVKALEAIMRDLPAKRDWLDPVVEAQVRATLTAAKGGKG